MPTLDDLLDATGVSQLGEIKTAAEAPDDDVNSFLKLAERCERAASTAPPNGRREQELVEKTAAIAVIARTLSEVDALAGGGEKTAADDSARAVFIERALAEGHPPEAIARFLKEAGAVSRAARGLLGHGGLGAAKALERAGGGLAQSGEHHLGAALRGVAEDLTPDKAGRYIDRLRARYGDDRVRNLIARSGAKLDHVPTVRDLLEAKPAAAEAAGGAAKPGELLRRAAAPAAGAAGGLLVGSALSGGSEGKRKRRDDAGHAQ